MCTQIFRLVVISERSHVYDNFEIPLINRLEKHFLTMDTVMTEEQRVLEKELSRWVEDFQLNSASLIGQRQR